MRRFHRILIDLKESNENAEKVPSEFYSNKQPGLRCCFDTMEFDFLSQYAWFVEDFDLWNELQSRGHEIMPHSLKHSNLKESPLSEAKELVLKCLEIFGKKLDSFDPSKAIFNFPYNQSSPEIEAWILNEVMAFRTGGSEINELPFKGMTRLTCTSYGPENIDAHLESRIQNLLALPEGWLIYNTHGLDDEGWGPVSSVYLDELLAILFRFQTKWLVFILTSFPVKGRIHGNKGCSIPITHCQKLISKNKSP